MPRLVLFKQDLVPRAAAIINDDTPGIIVSKTTLTVAEDGSMSDSLHSALGCTT